MLAHVADEDLARLPKATPVRLRHLEHAKAFYLELLKDNPPDSQAPIREQLARLYLELGDYEKAIAEATKSIEPPNETGGGSRNRLLNQFTANAIERPVIAGPAEATAAGNILVQAIAMGDLPSLAAGRELLRGSSEMEQFEPRDLALWQSARTRFADLL